MSGRRSALRTSWRRRRPSRRRSTAGGDRLDPDAREGAEAVLARAGERLRLGGDHTVVALVGATGSGKSSLFNALSGMEIADVGARRPLTAQPMACVWGDGGRRRRCWTGSGCRRAGGSPASRCWTPTGRRDLRGLVLLDLPDHDSTAVGAPARGRPARRPRRPARLGGRPAEVRRRGAAPRLPAPARRARRGDGRRAQPGRPARRRRRSRPACKDLRRLLDADGLEHGADRDDVGAPRGRRRRAAGAARGRRPGRSRPS